MVWILGPDSYILVTLIKVSLVSFKRTKAKKQKKTTYFDAQFTFQFFCFLFDHQGHCYFKAMCIIFIITYTFYKSQC